MTPNNFLRHPDDPAWHPGISGIDKLPSPPILLSGRRTDFIGVIVSIVAEAIFMPIVTLTGIKNIVCSIISDISFERPVRVGFQTRRGSGFSKRNDLVIN